MSDEKNTLPDDDAGVYVISVAAEISGMHPQTLRQYDKLGLSFSIPHRRTQSPLLITRHRSAAYRSKT
jgi:hypothetical protein